MGRISKGLLAGMLGISMIWGSMGTAAAENVKDYEGHWAQGTIEIWLGKGLLKGFADGSVKPDQAITRAEFMAIVNRSFEIDKLLNEAETPQVTFSDISPSSWAYKEVIMAVAAGYIQGYNDEVRPDAPVNRQEAAVIVSRLLMLELPQNTAEALAGFSDRGEVAVWSSGQVAALINADLIKGYPDGTFKPKRSLTRAEAVTLIEPLLQVSGGGEIYDHAGVYGGTDEQKRAAAETVVISADGVILQNMTIAGDLLLDAGIGNGDVTLKNVTVRGTTTVKGGGGDSVHLVNSELGNVVVNKAGGTVRLVAEGTTSVKQVTAQTSVKLEESGAAGTGFTNVSVDQDLTSSGPLGLSGTFDAVNLGSKAVLQLSEGAVALLTIGAGAGNSSVELAAGTKVTRAVLNAFTRVSGTGQIETAVLNEGAQGSTFVTKPLAAEGPQKDSLVITAAAATPSPAVIVGGDGGGGGSVPTATPAPTSTATPTPEPTATPSSSATTEPSVPDQDIPLLKTFILSSPDASVTNAVYLQFDYSAIPESILRSAGEADYYITSDPINERDLRWELNNRRAFLTMPAIAYLDNPVFKATVFSDYVGTGGEKYVTVVFRGKNGAVGYSTQKVNLRPSLTSKAANFVKLADGVSIEQDKQIINGIVNYSDIVDVSNVLSQNQEAAYYSIQPKYRSGVNLNLQVIDLLSYSQRLYTPERIRVVELYSHYPADLPVAELLDNQNAYIEQEYTIIFYDQNLQAISYYEGKVHLGDELAVEAAETRMSQIQGYPMTALQAENSILKAAKTYSALNDTLKAQVSQVNKDKLDKALGELEVMKQAGPLGSSLSLVSADIRVANDEFNGTTIAAYNQEYPYTFSSGIPFLTFYLTESPITLADIKASGGSGIQAFSSLAYLHNLDKKGDYYVTVVYYDQTLQPARYATQRVTLSGNTPIWDGTAIEVQEGISLIRQYEDSLRIDYVSFTDYLQAHPEAAYYTVTTGTSLAAAGAGLSAKEAVEQINLYQPTGSNGYRQIAVESNQVLNGQPEDYVIIFYDKDFKAVHYYIGTLKD